MKFEDLTGRRFGRLVVIERVANNPTSPSTRWLCKCDCGKETISYAPQLKNGQKKSCGCLCREHVMASAIKHGGRKTRLYHIWSMMKQRTWNPKHSGYKDYGARGIKVCAEWHDDFTAFRDWAYRNGYTEELSIDRIDNDRDYEPGNCRWVTMAEQNRNQRHNVVLELNGRSQLLADWARELGISKTALSRRINILKWPLERALTEKKTAPDAENI